MRRRPLSALCSAVSLLLCVVACVLGARSLSQDDYASLRGGSSWVCVNSEWRGVMQLTVATPTPYPELRGRIVSLPRVPDTWTYDNDYVWRFAGFGFANRAKILGSKVVPPGSYRSLLFIRVIKKRVDNASS